MSGLQADLLGIVLTLLDPAGLKVDGVAYTNQQANAEGQAIVF